VSPATAHRRFSAWIKAGGVGQAAPGGAHSAGSAGEIDWSSAIWTRRASGQKGDRWPVRTGRPRQGPLQDAARLNGNARGALAVRAVGRRGGPTIRHGPRATFTPRTGSKTL